MAVVVVAEMAVAVVVTRPTVSVPPYDVVVVVSDPKVVVTRDVIVWVVVPTVTVVVTVTTPTPPGPVPTGVNGPPGPVPPGGYGPPGPVPPPPLRVRVTSEPSGLVLTTVRGPSLAYGGGGAVVQCLFLRLEQM